MISMENMESNTYWENAFSYILAPYSHVPDDMAFRDECKYIYDMLPKSCAQMVCEYND